MQPYPLRSCSVEVINLMGEESSKSSWLEVRNDFRWIADPRWGSLRVYLDGKAIGWAPLDGSHRVAVQSGQHTVRAAAQVVFKPADECIARCERNPSTAS